jgi:hypothetical protein
MMTKNLGPLLTRTGILSVFVLFTTLLAPVRADDPEYLKIREGMKNLSPLIGTWDSVWKFHDKSGVSVDVGTSSVTSVLDDTYLQWHVEHHSKEDPKHSRSFIIYTTFDPRSSRYDQTYFYSRSALRVTETGVYDDQAREFRTTAFIPLEDGIHDENVRTIISLKDPNKIVYTHYSRYNNETIERMDLEVTLTRSH